MNTAIACASNPIQMSEAMWYAVIAGRIGYLAGRMKSKEIGEMSSPKNGLITS
jgi:thiazole synthase